MYKSVPPARQPKTTKDYQRWLKSQVSGKTKLIPGWQSAGEELVQVKGYLLIFLCQAGIKSHGLRNCLGVNRFKDEDV